MYVKYNLCLVRSFKTMSFTAAKFQINDSMSLYIPHVFPNINEAFITGVFESLQLGRVDHIDFVAKIDKSGKPYNGVYIHFAEWYTGPAVEHLQEKILNPNKEARIVYDDPWYWIVLENTGKKTVTMLPIAPGLSEIVLSSGMNDEIDNLISELYNADMDLTCEFDDYVDEEIAQLKTENKTLRTNIDNQLLHAEDCHTMIASLQLENIELGKQVDLLQEKLYKTQLALEETQCQLGYSEEKLRENEENNGNRI